MIRLIAGSLLLAPSLLLMIMTAPMIGLLSVPGLWLLLLRKGGGNVRNGEDERGGSSPDDKKGDGNDDTNAGAVAAAAASPSSSSSYHNDCRRKHVVITGGSSGIGLSVARDCARRRDELGVSRITIVARDADKLRDAENSVRNECGGRGGGRRSRSRNTDEEKKGKEDDDDETLKNGDDDEQDIVIETMSVDVTDSDAVRDAAKKIFVGGRNKGGPRNTGNNSTYLFCCAGAAEPSAAEETTLEAFHRAVRLNQMGPIHVVQSSLPYLRSGTIVLCSSACGQVGVYGYSSYCPTKFALRGYGEVLHAELSSSRPDLHVQVAYPPDTDTPGYERENRTKPDVTRAISEQGGLLSPDDVAAVMTTEALQRRHPKPTVTFNFDGWMLSTLTCGFGPVSDLPNAVAQVTATCLFRAVSILYLNHWWDLIRRDHQGKAGSAKQSPATAATETKITK